MGILLERISSDKTRNISSGAMNQIVPTPGVRPEGVRRRPSTPYRVPKGRGFYPRHFVCEGVLLECNSKPQPSVQRKTKCMKEGCLVTSASDLYSIVSPPVSILLSVQMRWKL